MKANNFRIYPLIVFFASLAYLGISIFWGFNIYDEAITLVGAKSIQNGLIPYKDFWTLYAPGQFYLISVLFSIFGTNLLVERFFTIIILSLFSVSIYYLLKKYIRELMATIFALTISIIFGYSQLYARSLPIALLLIIICIIIFSKYFYINKLSYILISGIVSGIVTLFRHDFGIYLIISMSFILIFYYILNRKIKDWKLKVLFYQLGIYYLGVIIILIPVIIYFLINVPINELYEQLFYFQINVFPEYRGLAKPVPFVSIHGDTIASKIQTLWFSLVYYIPLIIYVLTIISLSLQIKAKKLLTSNSLLFQYLTLIIIGLFLYNQALIRADFEHLLPTLSISIILLAFLLEALFIKNLKRIILALFVLFLVTIPLLKKTYQLFDSYDKTKYISLNTKHLEHILLPIDIAIDYQAIIDFIEENSGAGEKLFICNQNHDRILLNDLMLYFALDRQPSVKYYELHPGLATTDKIQNEIINELERKVTCFIIIRKDNEKDMQNLSSQRIGSNSLDEYIKAKYKIVKELNLYNILIRKDAVFYQELAKDF